MKAIVCPTTGGPEVLEVRKIEKPTPGDDEVLIRVRAATVTVGDVMLRGLPRLMWLPMRLFGFRRKFIPGHELAGDVEAVGKDVTLFRAGDPVFGTTTGLSTGANAEYVCVPQRWKMGVLTIKPVTMTYEEAAAVPVGGMTALFLLRKANILSGQHVLIYGASGSVGTYAVQLARYFGAKVTGVCSTANVELVKSLGAETVIDYTREDFTQSGQSYDLIFDAVGKISGYKGALKDDGQFLSVKSTTREKTEDLVFLRDIIEAGEIKAVIDRRFPLEQVAEAHRYVEQGHKKGNVVITIDPEERP